MPEQPEVGVTLHRPGLWVLKRVQRAGWTTTGVTWDRPDGTSAHWESRAARRRGLLTLHHADRGATRVDAAPETARRLTRLNLIAGIAFFVGGSLFALGACFAQLEVGTIDTVDVTYLIGGVFFSLGGYVSVLQAVNSPTTIDEHGSLSSGGWRWWQFLPKNLGWLSAFVLFSGTLFFAVSLVAAFAQGLTPRQINGWIWLPDITGCVCFLVSGHFALMEIGHGKLTLQPRELGWWIVAINQVGSVLFFVAGLAAFTRPATSAAVNLELVNWGTFLGALCFAVAGIVQLFDRPSSPANPRSERSA